MYPKATIITAEADPKMRDYFEHFLKPLGFQLIQASTGKEAIQTVSREHPSVLVLDFNIPDMDGFEVCRELRKDHGNDALAIIMLAGKDKDYESCIVKALEYGADDYTRRPVDDQEFLKKVNSLLEASRKEELPSKSRNR